MVILIKKQNLLVTYIKFLNFVHNVFTLCIYCVTVYILRVKGVVCYGTKYKC